MSKPKSAIRVVVTQTTSGSYMWRLKDSVTRDFINGESGQWLTRERAMNAGRDRAAELAAKFPTAQNMTAKLRETHPVMSIKETMNGLL